MPDKYDRKAESDGAKAGRDNNYDNAYKGNIITSNDQHRADIYDKAYDNGRDQRLGKK